MSGKIYILIIILTVIFVSLLVILRTSANKEGFSQTLTWKRDSSCKYKMNETISNSLKRNSINETMNDDFNIYLPCNYNNIDVEINKISNVQSDKKYFIIKNADWLSSKDKLWISLVKMYGTEKAKEICPPTYILYDDADMKLFKKEYDKNKIYIMKKNIQRQQGLQIVKNYDTILSGSKDGYVVVQELLQNPYLISGRKINLRIYLLITCKKNIIASYIHDDGFMYYTPELFVPNSMETNHNITTGYIDRQVYIDNPLTLNDFKKYLDADRSLTQLEQDLKNKGNILSNYVFNNIRKTIKMLINSMTKVCSKSKLDSSLSYQLFGVDIAISDNLNSLVIEVNKGPDIGCKDDRDCQVKNKMVDDILKVVYDDSENNFIRL
jgi:tubulin polyglutamylase TTLL1